LWPVIEKLLAGGIPLERILVLVATGTHRPLSRVEIEQMLDLRVFTRGIQVKNHNYRNKDEFVFWEESRGGKIYFNKDYTAADIKILTG